jgi:murein DD-endopeptidase MepM/ murein hydrolase activator NlpD
MPPQRRSLLLVTLAVVFVALAALGTIVWRHGASPSVNAPDGETPTMAASPVALASTVPADELLAAQNLEYAPSLDPFDVTAFLYSIGSDLASYGVERGDERLGFGDLVARAAERHSVNPRVLLVLIELATGAVSAPSADTLMGVAGYSTEVAADVEAQIERLAERLATHYVAASMGDEPMVVHGPGGASVAVVATGPAPAAIGRTLAEIMPLGALQAAVSGERPTFQALYRQWFGDPHEMPMFARDVSLPADAAWPFEGAKRHTSGPHVGTFCSQQRIAEASGLDFGGEAHEVLAMADGRYRGRGETSAAGYQAGKYVLLEHEGGIQVMYWHLGGFSPELQALEPGAAIPKGFPVGWSGRSGNQSAVHLHVELRRGAVPTNPYSGVRVSWDGQTVDGWTIRMFRWPGTTDRGISYRGSAVRGETRVMALGNCACDQARADALVSAQHPGTAAPRNGMDANTVLANYPDVGLLPSSNVRTTTSWATAERVWHNWLPWYYLIEAEEAYEVSLDGVPLFSAPACARAVWLGIGEHRLTWRYRDHGRGAPPVRLVAWPFEQPACAADPLGAAPRQLEPPAAMYADAAFASREAQVAEVAGTAGDVVTATWHLHNTGTASWGEGYALAFVSGWPLQAGDAVRLPAAEPGQEVRVTAPITVPSIEGVAYGTWRLVGPDGQMFGPPLVAAARAAAEGASDSAQSRGAPTSLALLQPVSADGGVAYLAEREVTLRWAGVAAAEGYVVHLSLSPTPAEDPAPVYREALEATVCERRLVFDGDAPRLYWQVTARTSEGEVSSAVGVFGVDTQAPTCTAAMTPVNGHSATVRCLCEDAVSGIASWDSAYRREGTDHWRPLLIGGAGDALELPIRALLGGEYAVRCRARDHAGNEGAWSTDSEGAMVVLGEAARADVVGSGPFVTTLPGGRLFVEVPARSAGDVRGNASLALVVESGIGGPETVHRWDLLDVAPGEAVTLTAVIANPVEPAEIGGGPEAPYRFSVQSEDEGGTQLAAVAEVCLARPDAYEAWDPEGDGAHAGAGLAPGQRHTRGFHAPWDVDETRLAVERGQTYLLWAEGADVVIDVFDAAGRLVGSTGDSSERGARVVWTAAEDGVYRATGRPWAPGSEGCGSTYVLRLQTDPPAAAVPEIPGLRARLRLPLIVHP